MFKLICGIVIGAAAAYWQRDRIANGVYIFIMYLQNLKDWFRSR